MEYKDMNIFDIASVLQNLMFDENLMFSIMINGESFNLYQLDVENGEICLTLNSSRIEVKKEKNHESKEGN